MASNSIGVTVQGEVFSLAQTAFNITTATVIKASPGMTYTVSVIVAGTTPGTLNDCTTTAAAAVGNQIAVIPNTAGAMTSRAVKHSVGIVLVPGTGQTLAIQYQ